ncbi:hypothetical protein FNV43_RR14034 [Rhamnella rubrinervis]|uniref:Benzyl alcohol O-benzoyltransferase n=1 Tax=Rhamnella rubrinervis TaxID=2594499 RepID=A0A8K0H2I8_9ROSA|nr:hypothetical protein FNV43_RR14034 [Rhamnella rubrinervis]
MLNFTVEVGAPELIRPEKSTPREFKYLSNIDDQTGLRNHIPFVHFLPPNVAMHNNDPVVMIKQALSKVLVFYYPVAGRLRNADKGKLVVDCCGEGVIFRGGNADITLKELCNIVDDDGLKPPFPEWDKLLVDDIWGSNFITDSPLLRMQVTELSCGGFVLAYTFNHCICDAYGAYQFIKAVSEFCISACLWRARTRTLIGPRPESSSTTTRLLFPVDTRFRYEPLLPEGYYGSAVVFPCAITKASKLVHKPLTYAASLISAVKNRVAENEYRASVLDFIEVNGRKGFCSEGAFVVSDMTRLRFMDLDFGWGSKAVYGGPARAGTGLVPGMVTSLVSHKNKEGVDGMLALVSLPSELVDKFHMEVRKEIGCVSLPKPVSAL